MYTRFCSNVLFPLHERLKRHHSVELREQLEASQWWPVDRLRLDVIDRLRSFLQAVERDVPYYRDVFQRAGFDAASVADVADLQRLPLLDKPTIRANLERLKATGAGRLARYNTGGSSGEPLVFFIGPGRVSHDVAAKWRATRWWNVDIGDREAVLWGSPVELGRQDRLKALRDRIFRSRLLPAFDMSEQRMDQYLDELGRFRPRMLFGYASALALLAAHARRRARSMRGIGVEVAFCTGETLYPDQRHQIAEAFGCRVANGYGSRDAGFIAHECPQGSLHVSAEHIVVELLGSDGGPVPDGEQGEIVVTHLATQDFPFVRYRTGDLAVRSTQACLCGRTLPVLAQVNGRSTDFIRTRSGATMHALALIYEVRDKPGVRSFKFIQASDYSIELQLVTDEAWTHETEATVLQGLIKRLGPDSRLTIRYVDSVPPEPSGKYRYVVSRVQQSEVLQ